MAVFLLSFLPYFLPQEQQPLWYHDGLSKEEIAERRVQRYNSAYLGGDVSKLDAIFGEDPP